MNLIKKSLRFTAALCLLHQDWTRTHRILSLGKMWRSVTDWGKLFFADTRYLDCYSVELIMKELNTVVGVV